ncbi:MAG TPA: methyl-accepting chemotaxis protein [Solirubrobacteraceae bacterium]|jgi:methyl-accepting chemotaxis protein|nr:methyl-accepting chemotaxis protein [Solirubrobacteraceae bacterium]
MATIEQAQVRRREVGPTAKAAYAVFGAMVLAYTGLLFARGNGVTWDWLDGWGTATFEAVMSILVIVKGLVSPRDRKWCTLLGFGGLAWAAGDFAMTSMANPPTLSSANILWYGFFPLAYVGVMVLMQRDVRKLTAANYLDGVVATLVTAALLVAFAFHWITDTAGGGSYSVGVNLVYPVGDLLLSGLTIIGVMLLPRGQRLRWGLIAAAGLLNAAGDISALFGGIVATDIGFVINTMAWPGSLFLISAAAWAAPGASQAPRESKTSGFLVPSVASVIALVILFVSSLNHSNTTQVAVALSTATLVAAGARFYLALKRMTQLAEEREQERLHAAEVERETQVRAADAEREAQARAAEAERKSQERAAEAEREAQARAAEAEREALEKATATEREFLEKQAASERATREVMEHAVHSYSVFAAQVADGDLTATVEPQGDEDLRELAGSLNRMVSSLADISGQIQSSVSAIGSSTTEILTSAHEHGRGAEQQSAAITQASATVQELRAAADEMARQAEDVAREAGDSVRVSDEGSTALQAIASAMEEIRDRVASIATEIAALSDRTEQIGDITATVNELADRSNLLALNAGIEAARAGEHGRSFAVVAEQVRGLAEQSKQATGRIESILNEVRRATLGAVKASEAGTQVVDRGLELTVKASDGVQSLAETIHRAAGAAGQIAAAAQQQSVGMDQIAESMNELELNTTGFVEGAARSQTAAEHLDDLTNSLAAATSRYRVAPVDAYGPAGDEPIRAERIDRSVGPSDREEAVI